MKNTIQHFNINDTKQLMCNAFFGTTTAVVNALAVKGKTIPLSDTRTCMSLTALQAD